MMAVMPFPVLLGMAMAVGRGQDDADDIDERNDEGDDDDGGGGLVVVVVVVVVVTTSAMFASMRAILQLDYKASREEAVAHALSKFGRFVEEPPFVACTVKPICPPKTARRERAAPVSVTHNQAKGTSPTALGTATRSSSRNPLSASTVAR
ncbi:hypothetical protein AK812_SmicGene23876 [Symbiodinium microadriaticum]|uniref:Uncharacterized protein n=1 Tax=Symbiodinium microadriaticum TaxID=2951 RepID=A0A1Q9DG07_SYMMI|nr:hypothetical protein AK812_SmicGene23876 [Symbiodinium microadriaticum]